MRIERVICDRCGYEEQEDDYDPANWDLRYRGDVCKACATPRARSVLSP